MYISNSICSTIERRSMGVMQHDPFIPKITGIFSSLPNIKSLHDGDSEYGCLVLMPSKHLRENPRYSMLILQLGKLVSGRQFSKIMIPAITFSHFTCHFQRACHQNGTPVERIAFPFSIPSTLDKCAFVRTANYLLHFVTRKCATRAVVITITVAFCTLGA